MNMNVSKTNGVKLFALVAVLAMVFAGTAVMMSDNGVDAANDDVTYLGGTIKSTDPQYYDAGTNIEVIRDLVIPKGITLTIAGTLTVPAEYDIEIQDGGTLNFLPGAHVVVNGSITINNNGVLNNSTTGTTSSEGLYINGSLNVDNGGKITGTTENTITDNTTYSTVTATLVDSTDAGTGTVFTASSSLTLSKNDNTDGKIVITGTMEKHMRGDGQIGYWVGFNIASITAGKYTQTINGVSKTTTVENNGYSNWLDAGKYYVITLTPANGGNATTFAVDLTGVNATTGEIYVNGQMTTGSNNKGNSEISGQTIYVAQGATAKLNSEFTAVTVSSYQGSTKSPYVCGSVELSTTGGDKASDLTFTTSSERFSVYVFDKVASGTEWTGDINSRFTSYILDVSGTVNHGTEIKAIPTNAIAGAYMGVYYLNEDGDDLNGFPVMGQVSVAGTLNVYGTFAASSDSNIDVSGTLNIRGDTKDKAVFNVWGNMTVSGVVAINSIDNTDGSVSMNSGFKGYFTIVDSGKITVADADDSAIEGAAGINGAAYYNDDQLVISNLADVITAAVADNESEVYVYGFDLKNEWTGWTDESNNTLTYYLSNPYTVSADITIPETINLNLTGPMTISEGVTMTISEGADVDYNGTNSAIINVEGTLMDYEILDFTYGATEAVGSGSLVVNAEVKFSDDEGTYDMYTSLKNALAGTAGTVVLFGDVEVDGTLTIPEGFTVELGNEVPRNVTVLKDSELIVNGVIDTQNGKIILTPGVEADKTEDGKLTVNNMIVGLEIYNGAAQGAANIAGSIPGFTANGTIGDYEDADFLLAPAVAATNAATLYDITAQGKLTYSGELTFTAGEDNAGETITIAGTEVTLGTIIVDGFSIELRSGTFTGTIQMNVTAGNSAIAFEKAVGYAVDTVEDVTGDVDVTTMTLAVISGATADGKVTIASGSVQLASEVTFGADKDATLTIASGATLVVPEKTGITIVQGIANNAAEKDKFTAMAVDGTLDIQEGADLDFTGTDYKVAIVTIDGTMNVAAAITLDDDVYVDGTVNVVEDGNITLKGDMYVNGTITGAVDIDSDNEFIITYPGASMDGADLNIDTDGESQASATVLYINGDVYMTVYGLDEADVITALGNETYDIVGYEPVTAETIVYTDADYQNKLADGAILEDTPVVYVKLKAQDADIIISVGTGMSLYIDGIKFDGILDYSQKTVGTHTVEVTINPGYKGDATITFNGQTITDGKFTITPEMAAENADPVVLSVTGNMTEWASPRSC